MNWSEIEGKLAVPFDAKKISWRVGSIKRDKSKGMVLAYIDARDAMKRLDDVCGHLWQVRYPLADNGLLICEVGLKIDGEWIWRGNGAGDTAVEAEKGKASDAFKRAAVMWGIGRYLYALPAQWLPLDENKKIVGEPQLPTWATPKGYLEYMERRKSEEARQKEEQLKAEANNA